MQTLKYTPKHKDFNFARISHVTGDIDIDDNFLDCSRIEQKFIIAQLNYLKELKGHNLENLHEADMKAFNDFKEQITAKELVQFLSKVALASKTKDGLNRVKLFFATAIELGYLKEKSR